MDRDALLAALPEDIRGDKALEGVQDLTSLAKGYIEKATAKPEPQVELPESADKYELEIPKFEGMEKLTPEIEADLKDIRQFGFDLKMSKEQVQAITDRYAKDFAESIATAKAESDKLLAPLKKEWADQYDERIAEANLAVTKLGGNQLHDLLRESGLGAHPVIIKLFHKLLPLVTEKGAGRGEAHPGAPRVEKSAEEVLYPSMAR